MKILKICRWHGFVCGILLAFCLSAQAEEQPLHLSLQQMVDRILGYYPSLEIAALQVEQARQEFAKVKSTLGWKLASQAGVSRDVNFIDATTDRYDVYASLQRSLESGSQIEIAGQYVHEDSSLSFSPLSPNPSQRSGIDLKYRIPLARGKDNIQYQEQLNNAVAGLQLERANQVLAIDNLVQQAIGIYFDAANAAQRLLDAEDAIERASRLQKYIKRNHALGLAEQKDLLRIESQLRASQSRRDGVGLTWKALRSELNRLMGYRPGTVLVLQLPDDQKHLQDSKELETKVLDHSPALAIQGAIAKLAESSMNLTRNQRQEQLDVVLSAGARYATGDTPTGDISRDEIIGGARLEYQFDLDQSGFDASLYQSQLEYQVAQEEQQRIRHDLRYSVTNLVEQVQNGHKAVNSYRDYVAIETQKLEEALARYREGRATTNELIDFENDLNISKTAFYNQKVELARAQATLRLLAGELWKPVLIDTYLSEKSAVGAQK